MDRITDIVHTNATGQVLASFHYTRNPLTGVPEQITREDGTYVLYGYDAALRLESEEYHSADGSITRTIGYTYDAAGNRLTRSDSGQTLTSVLADGYQLDWVTLPDGTTAEDYTYDLDGNITGISRSGQSYSLSYNTSGQVTAVTGSSMNLSYTYDGEGNRVGVTDSTGTHKLVLGTNDAGLSAPQLITDASGALQAGFVYGDMAPLMRFDASGNPVYYLEDAMGTVTGLANSQGQSLASFRYDGYGNLLSQTGQTAPANVPGDFRFQGQWQDATTGLYDMRARTYDPITGRFTSRDPQAPDQNQPESWNEYAFANGNPLVYSDPTGQFSLAEMNVAQLVQRIVDGLEKYGKYKVQKEMRDQITNAASKVLTDLLVPFLPGGKEFQRILNFKEELSQPWPWHGGSQGQVFERLIVGQLRKYASAIPGFDKMWLVPRVGRDGIVKSMGFSANENCKWFGLADVENYQQSGSEARPDFIFSPNPPTWDDPARVPYTKSWFIGDFKKSQRSVWNSMRKNSTQWNAIISHAAARNGHQVVPLALYVTFYTGSPAEEAQIVARALKSNVFSLVVSMTKTVSSE